MSSISRRIGLAIILLLAALWIVDYETSTITPCIMDLTARIAGAGYNPEDKVCAGLSGLVGGPTTASITAFIREDVNEMYAGITAVATAFIACFAIALSLETRRMRNVADQQRIEMRRATEIARQTAEAANTSAKAAEEMVRVMREAERPYVIPHNPILENFVEVVRNTAATNAVRVYFAPDNRGKGLAFLETHATGHEVRPDSDGLPMPAVVQPGFGRMPLGPGSMLRSDTVFVSFEISGEDLSDIRRYRKSLYIYGYFQYSDISRVTRRTGFIFEFVPHMTDIEQSAFVIHPSEEWWFDREEEPGGGKREKGGAHGTLSAV